MTEHERQIFSERHREGEEHHVKWRWVTRELLGNSGEPGEYGLSRSNYGNRETKWREEGRKPPRLYNVVILPSFYAQSLPATPRFCHWKPLSCCCWRCCFRNWAYVHATTGVDKNRHATSNYSDDATCDQSPASIRLIGSTLGINKKKLQSLSHSWDWEFRKNDFVSTFSVV